MAPDAHDRVDAGALRHEVEDALEESPRMPGPGGALRQRHALGHLDDPQRGQLATVRIEQVRAEPDQLLGSRRVRDGDDDPGGQRSAHHDGDQRFKR